MIGTTAAALLLAGAGTQFAGQALAGRSAGRANDRAAATQAQSDAATLQFAKEQEATRRAEFDKTLASEEARWKAEQEQNKALYEEDQLRYADEQARKQPYQQASYGALTRLGDLVGVQVPAYRQPRDPYALGSTPISSVGAPVSTKMPVANPQTTYAAPGTFSSMIKRVNPVDPQDFVSMRKLAGMARY